MLLFFDMDDVICDLMTPWLSAINAVSGESLRREDITDWDVGRFTRIGNQAYQFIHEPWLYGSLRLMPGAARVLGRLIDAGHDIYILTAAVPEAATPKAHWVDEHLPWLGHRRMWLGHDKWRLARPGALMVDDKPANIRDWRAAGGIGLVFDQPWNQDVTGPRVRSWPELERWVAQHARQGAAV